MIRICGMDFVILVSKQDAVSVLNAWCLVLLNKADSDSALVARYLSGLIEKINQDRLDVVNLDPPDQDIDTEKSCKLLAVAISQVVFDIAKKKADYDGFPEDRKFQLFWMTWNIMFYEQLANYLFESDVSLAPISINLPEKEEWICRYVRNQIYDRQYKEIIDDNYVDHLPAAEIRLESVNDSIELVTKLLKSYDLAKELALLYVERIRILTGLGRNKEAAEANVQVRSILNDHQGNEDYLKVLEQESIG